MKVFNNIIIIVIYFSLLMFISCSGTQGFGRLTQFKEGSNNHEAILDDYQVESISVNDILNTSNNELGEISLESRINASPIIEEVEFSDSINSEGEVVIKAKICDQDGEINQEIFFNLSISNSLNEPLSSVQATSLLAFADENNANSLCTEYIFTRNENLPQGQYKLVITVSDKYGGTSKFEQNFDVLPND